MFLILCLVAETNFEFAFAGYYGDNMVLQRAPHKAVVWGYAPVLLENTTVLVILKSNGGTDEINREYRTTIRNTGEEVLRLIFGMSAAELFGMSVAAVIGLSTSNIPVYYFFWAIFQESE